MKLIIIIFLSFLLSRNALSQETQHFQFKSNTGNNATVGIPLSANPNIGGVPISLGDEIGVFSSTGLCVGAIVWTLMNNAITVWGDDEMTPEIDGIQVGDSMHYRIWKASENKEYIVDNISYSLGNGIYQINGIYILNVFFVTTIYKELSISDFYLSDFYPNPIDDFKDQGLKVFISYKSPTSCSLKISMFNILGQKLWELEDIYINKSSVKQSLEISSLMDKKLSKGIYFLRFEFIDNASIQTSSKIFIRKLIIRN